MFNQGISRSGEVIDMAVSAGLVNKAGAWYEHDGTKIAQGREAAKQYLEENPKVLADLESAIRKLHGIK